MRVAALLLLALAPAPVLAQADTPFCIFSLKACDYDREDAGVCPTGTAATASLFPEGEHWYLETTGVAADPADGPSTQAETLQLFNAGDTGDSTRVFYILDRPGLDGVLLISATGDARLSVVGDAGPDRTRFEILFTGRCEVITP